MTPVIKGVFQSEKQTSALKSASRTLRRVCVFFHRFKGLVPEEHSGLLPPKPAQWKGQHWGQHQGEQRGQRSEWRGWSSAGQTEDPRCRAAVQLPGRDGPPSGSSAAQAGITALGHVPRTPAARQVGVGSPVQVIHLNSAPPANPLSPSLPLRSMDGSLYHDSYAPQKQEAPLRDLTVDQPSPGTLV